MAGTLVAPKMVSSGGRKLLSTSVYSYQYGTHRHLHNDDIVGARQFPTGTAGKGTLRIDPVTGRPDSYRCQQCGFGCVVANGIASPTTANQGDGFISNDATTGDPTISRGGCPFCGTANSRRN